MSVVLQVSDTHFGTELSVVMEALLQRVHAQRPGLVVLSGDLTQRARRSQFHAARVLVERIAVATLVLPGNHDIPLFNLERWDHDAPAQRCTLVDQATISLMKSGERQ